MNRTIGLVTANYEVAGYGELTKKRPPASLPFDGRYRLMDFALSNLVNSRITTVGLITPYYYRSILDHVGAGKEWGLDRKDGGLFILPGTVFGVKEADTARFLFRDVIHNESYLQQGDADYILVTSCSMIYNMDYRPMIEQHELSGRPMTFLYKKMTRSSPHPGYYMDLDGKGRVVGLEKKAEGENLFLDAFIINKTFLLRMIRDFRAQGFMDFLSILAENLEDIHVGAYAFDGYVGFTDGIGDYMRTSREMLDPAVRRQVYPPERQVVTKIHDTPPALYQPGSSVRNSVMTAGSIIEGTVENSIVSRGVRVRKGAVVRNAVLMEGCVVGEGAWLEHVVCDKNVTISDSTCITGSPEHPCIIPKDRTV